MVSVAKSLCSSSERASRRRPPSENKSRLALFKTVLNFVNEMHLPVKGKRRSVATRKEIFDPTSIAVLVNCHFVSRMEKYVFSNYHATLSSQFKLK